MEVKEIEEKVKSGKSLSKEETKTILKDEPAAEGFKPGIVEENIEWPAKAEDVDVEKKVEAPAKQEVKKEDKKAEAIAPVDVFERLETELVKPEGKEDLTKFSEREKAYFHQMRRDRKSKQIAEERADKAEFNMLKLKQSVKQEPAKPEEDPLADLDKKDPTDFLTVAEVKALFKKVNAKPEAKKEDDQPSTTSAINRRFVEMCDKEARSTHEDYDTVMILADEILTSNTDYLSKVETAFKKGENPALVAYDLIKKDPEFAKLFPVAQTKAAAFKGSKTEQKPEDKKAEAAPDKKAEDPKEKAAQAAQDALENNNNKTKTTGHVSASDDTSLDGYSLHEIAAMSDRAFAALPKRTRAKYLEQMREV